MKAGQIITSRWLERVSGPAVDFAWWLALATVSLVFLTGCETTPLDHFVIGKGYQPANVYHPVARLPEQVRRVAVLPMTYEEQSPDAAGELEMFKSVLHVELARTRKFELVMVQPEQLRQLTGKTSWTAEEKLPANFFEMLRETLGCDAVLFNRLTVFRAYPPLAVGWNLKLLDSQTARVYWAGDEVFDAGDARVANSARRFQQQPPAAVLVENTGVLQSPLRFGHYSTAALLATLPER